MDIDITVALSLQFFDCQKELLIELLVELVENQAAAGGYKRAVRVGIFFIADVHDGLGLFVDRVEHLHKVCLVIAIIAIGFGDGRIDRIERAFNDVVHLRDHDAFGAERFAFFGDEAADEIQFLRLEGIEHAFGAFVDCGDDLLNIKRLFCAVFFDDIHSHTRSSLDMM